jgi:hypothetical protein
MSTVQKLGLLVAPIFATVGVGLLMSLFLWVLINGLQMRLSGIIITIGFGMFLMIFSVYIFDKCWGEVFKGGRNA